MSVGNFLIRIRFRARSNCKKFILHHEQVRFPFCRWRWLYLIHFNESPDEYWTKLESVSTFSFIRTVKLEGKVKVVEYKAWLKWANSSIFIHPLTIERSLVFLVLLTVSLFHSHSRHYFLFPKRFRMTLRIEMKSKKSWGSKQFTRYKETPFTESYYIQGVT
jgi:hypothetical protein